MPNLIELEDTWEYLEVPLFVPPDPSTFPIPPSGFVSGQAPFGTMGSFLGPYGVNTAWNLNTSLWIKKTITVDGYRPIMITGRIENGLLVYWDGTYIGGFNPTNGDSFGVPFYYVIVPKDLATPGSHTLAIYSMDEPGTSPDDTTYLYGVAEYLPAFISVPAQAPIRERLSWLTDVLTAEDSTEQRLQLRTSARQEFSYSLPVDREMNSQAFNITWGARDNQWLVPVWQEVQQLGPVAAGDRILTATVDVYDFRDSSLALLWESSSSWQLVGIEVVGSGELVLSNLTQAFSKAWLLPVRFGRLIGNTNRKTNSYNSVWQLTFQIEDNSALTVSEPDQFLSEDIYFLEGLLSGGQVQDNVAQQIDVADYELGVVAYRSPWANARKSRPYRRVLVGPTEVREYKEWLYRRAGKYRGFWSPSLDADLRVLSTGTVTTILLVSADDYLEWASARIHVAVEVSDGTWYARTISSALRLNESTVQLNLDSPLNIEAEDIQRVSYLALKRLDTDRVELRWPGSGVCEANVRLLEVGV